MCAHSLEENASIRAKGPGMWSELMAVQQGQVEENNQLFQLMANSSKQC